MDVRSAVLLLVVLGLLALAIAVLMLVVFAQVIGWRTLSRSFPASGSAHAAPAPSDGVVLGVWGWNAPPLRVALDDEGLWMFPRAPFAVAFRNVRLPWNAVLAVGPKRFMLFDVIELRYGAGPKDRIGFLAGATASAVARMATARGALPLPVTEDA